jgi:hypothetical protein
MVIALSAASYHCCYLVDGFSGGEGHDVGAGNLVAALRVAVHGGLGVQDGLEPLRLERLVVAVPPLVVAVGVHDHDRRVAALSCSYIPPDQTLDHWPSPAAVECSSIYTYPDGAVVEEEPERGGRGDGRLRHGLLHGAPDDDLQFGAGAGIVVRPQLGDGRRRHETHGRDEGGDDEDETQPTTRHRW